MNFNLVALAATAVSISFFHTASGPDHYLPFIVLSRARKWTLSRTILLTVICGLGHVLSSVVLGLVGVYLGWQLNRLAFFQDMRGNVSGWVLLLLGLAYTAYGFRHAYLNRPHKHFDVMLDEVYVFEHRHGEMVMPDKRVKVTPLVLFAIFVMGPSEPLIPLLFFSGTHRSTTEVVVLIVAFTLSTVITMTAIVLLGCYGYSFVQTDKMERYVHAVSGSVVTLCAVGILFLGW